MLDHISTAKNFLTTPVIKDIVLWLLSAALTFILSRSPIGRRVWFWMKNRVLRLDPEAARKSWHELQRDIAGGAITAEASLYALRDNGMPRPCLIPVDLADGLGWMRDPAIVAAARSNRPAINKTHGFASGSAFKSGDRANVDYVAADYAMVTRVRQFRPLDT